MKTEQNHAIPRIFIIVTVSIGLLLSAFSLASGNNPLIQPDLSTYQEQLQKNPVTADQLASWMVEGRRDFQLIGFLDKDKCAEQKKTTTLLNCYDVEKSTDLDWIRKKFRNIEMPIIVYGGQSQDGLVAAANLKHFGYTVRYLAGGFDRFANQHLNPDLKDIDLANADRRQLEKLSVLRFFTGDDPLVKKKGQKWMMASADGTAEIEEEEVELGEDQDEGEGEGEDEEEEEGC
ncbi:MAG: hypothetical protein HQ517_10205 [SAR324 cluster bacterium]|nr:hypothetical protein [SAR324 cluster bacterium]